MQHPSKTLLFSWGEEKNLYLICPVCFGKASQLEMDRQALQKALTGAKQRVLLLQGLIQKMWISFPVLWEFVTRLLQRGDMKYDRLSLRCGKQLGLLMEQELLPQTLKTAFKGGEAAKWCRQRWFPWVPPCKQTLREELHMREGTKEPRRPWGIPCNFNKRPAELRDKVPAGKKLVCDSFCWTSVFLNKQVHTTLCLPVKTTSKPTNIDWSVRRKNVLIPTPNSKMKDINLLCHFFPDMKKDFLNSHQAEMDQSCRYLSESGVPKHAGCWHLWVCCGAFSLEMGHPVKI